MRRDLFTGVNGGLRKTSLRRHFATGVKRGESDNWMPGGFSEIRKGGMFHGAMEDNRGGPNPNAERHGGVKEMGRERELRGGCLVIKKTSL